MVIIIDRDRGREKNKFNIVLHGAHLSYALRRVTARNEVRSEIQTARAWPRAA